jgi:sugar-specific transcriptional regulator TrmB
MLNNKDAIVEFLRKLNLTTEEAKLYLELLREPNTHLKLAHATGINRTKIYRLADQLEKRSLITTRTDDRGTFLVAADPATLEVTLVTQEAKLQEQRNAFDTLMPILMAVKEGDPSEFVVHTYEGSEGFKQMLWHELKTKDEALIFGSGTIEDLVTDKRWAERHREMTIEKDYTVRELLNPGGKKPVFTLNQEFVNKYYSYRVLPSSVMYLQNQMVIYNNTVGMYHWRQEQKVGVEIINKNYATLMRQIFERYWEIAGEYEGKLAL